MAHRIRLRAQKQLYRSVPEDVLARRLRRPSTATSWPAEFEPVDRQAHPETTSLEQLEQRTFDLVGETASLDGNDWSPSSVSQLWRYHLHYFEWAWPLVDAPEGRRLFEKLWCSWRSATRLGRWDAWSPYVAAVRAWTMCALHRPLVDGSPYESTYVESLRVHAGYVRANLELDVGGNHLVKNIKALIGLGVFLDDKALLERGLKLLRRELAVQVLPDGGHFERSPSYHAQVLGDLVDIHGLLEAGGHSQAQPLADPTARMRGWLAHILMPDDTVPLLRDCVPVSSARLDALGVERLGTRERLTVLNDSGYVIVDTGRLHAVLDVGQPCPPALPAHAQADSLNWVLHVDGRPVVVDTGTSSYQDPEVRAYERSTAAHNTVEVDGQNSTEVFGSFRAGRRAHVTLVEATDDGKTITVTAEHDGYRFLDGSPVHRRTWTIGASRATVSDLVSGTGPHAVTSRMLLLDDAAKICPQLTMSPPAATTSAECSLDMGRRQTDVIVHASTVTAELPLELDASITLEALGSD